MLTLRRTLIIVLSAFALLIPPSSAFAGGAGGGENVGESVEIKTFLKLSYDPDHRVVNVAYDCAHQPGCSLRLQKCINKHWQTVGLGGIHVSGTFLYGSLPLRRLRQTSAGRPLRFLGLDSSSSSYPHHEATLTPIELRYPKHYLNEAPIWLR